LTEENMMEKIKNGSPGARGMKTRFSLLQFTFWCSWSSFTSFAALFFKHVGLTDAETGLALSLSALFGIPGQAVWGFLCDKLRTGKKVFISANVLILLIILMFTFIRGTVPIMVLMSLLGFTQIPQPAVLDSWILGSIGDRKEDYGHIRLWASLGFAVSALLFGKLIRLLGYPVMFISASIFIILTVAISITIPESAAMEKEKARIRLLDDYREIAHNRRFLFFLLIGFMIGLAARTTHMLLPLIIEKVQGTADDLGMAFFITGLSEIPMLAASKRLTARFHAMSLIMVSALLYIGQFSLMLLASSPTLIFFAMAFQGLAFGNFLPSVRLFVRQHAPGDLKTSAQTLTDGIVSSLAGVIGSAAGGMIIQRWGAHMVIMMCIALSAAACLILAFKRLPDK
jgi:PPP family 3-phenylpropionic acid transporter